MKKIAKHQRKNFPCVTRIKNTSNTYRAYGSICEHATYSAAKTFRSNIKESMKNQNIINFLVNKKI